jgi:hypothetical protein
MCQDSDDQATALGLSPVEHAAWNLLYNMVEAGAQPKEGSWFYHEFRHLREALEEKGLNTNPGMVEETG